MSEVLAAKVGVPRCAVCENKLELPPPLSVLEKSRPPLLKISKSLERSKPRCKSCDYLAAKKRADHPPTIQDYEKLIKDLELKIQRATSLMHDADVPEASQSKLKTKIPYFQQEIFDIRKDVKDLEIYYGWVRQKADVERAIASGDLEPDTKASLQSRYLNEGMKILRFDQAKARKAWSPYCAVWGEDPEDLYDR